MNHNKVLYLIICLTAVFVTGIYAFQNTEAMAELIDPESWYFRIPIIDGAIITRLDNSFGKKCDHLGQGHFMDISPIGGNFDEGVPIYAVGDGKIIDVVPEWYWGFDYGLSVVQESYGAYYRYAHLAKIYVNENQTVEQGDLIGLLGNTGNSKGAHLHWDAWEKETGDAYDGLFEIQNVEEWSSGTDPCSNPGTITAESLDKNHSYHPEGTSLDKGCPKYFNQMADLRRYGINFVTLFDHSNCLGNMAHIYVPGKYNLASEKGFNDRTRSIYIPPGWSVKLYAHNDSTNLSSDCRTVDMWNLDVDSYFNNANIKMGWDRYYGLTNAKNVYDNPPTIIKEEDTENFQRSVSNGWNMVSRIDVFDNDKCIPPQGEIPIVLFTQIGGTGGMNTGPLAPGDTISVHADPNYTFTRYGWHDEGKWNLPDYMQNSVTSVGVQSGWSVALFDGLEQTGAHICVKANDANLNDNILTDGSNANERAESAIVFNNSNCNGMDKPDLVAEEIFVSIDRGITYPYEILKANEPAYIDWHLQNKGNTSVSNQFYVDVWIDDTRYIHYPFNSLGSQVRVGFDDWEAMVPEGGYFKVRLVVDPDNVIDEIDESNNVWEKSYTWDAPRYSEAAVGCDVFWESGIVLVENPRCGGFYESWILPGTRNLTYVNNAASSIRISSAGLAALVYEGANLTGQHACVSYSIDDLALLSWPDGTSMNDSISSFEVYYNPYCIKQGSTIGNFVVYNDQNFDDPVASYDEAGKYHVPSIMDNAISSIDIAEGWSVMLYDGYDQTGSSTCRTEDDNAFTAEDVYDDGVALNNSISSLELFHRDYCIISGDANGDNKVDGLDYAFWFLHFGQLTENGAADGDFNFDGKVDGIDYAIWFVHFGYGHSSLDDLGAGVLENYGRSKNGLNEEKNSLDLDDQLVGLYFDPSSVTIPPDKSLDLIVNPGSNPIVYIDVELSFDPSLIQLTGEIQPSEGFSTVIRKTSKTDANATGKIELILALPTNADPPTGSFEFAKMTFGPVTYTSDQIAQIKIVDQGVQIINSDTNEIPFTSAQATVIVNPVNPTPCPPITDWKGQYWNNSDLTGQPILCRNDVNIDFEWFENSPDPLVQNEQFSARWTRSINLSEGSYRFEVFHDDGARLFVDGVKVIDNWCENCRETDRVDLPITSGAHTIVLEIFENQGWASAKLTWEKLTPPGIPTPIPTPTKTPVPTQHPPNLKWHIYLPVVEQHK